MKSIVLNILTRIDIIDGLPWSNKIFKEVVEHNKLTFFGLPSDRNR